MEIKLVKYMLADHKALRGLMKELKSEERTQQQKLVSFAHLVTVLSSHSHAEEEVAYGPAKKAGDSLRDEAMEGFQEHHVLTELVEKISRTENSELWQAKAKVLCDLLEHHLDEEEEEFFPELHKAFENKEAQEKAAEKYLVLRAQEQPRAIRKYVGVFEHINL